MIKIEIRRQRSWGVGRGETHATRWNVRPRSIPCDCLWDYTNFGSKNFGFLLLIYYYGGPCLDVAAVASFISLEILKKLKHL